LDSLSGFDSEADQQDVMANIKSQIKRNRQAIKRTERNKAVRSELKTRTKAAVQAVSDGAENAEELTRLAVKRIDMAAAKGVIHKNAAARRKSRLMKKAAPQAD
jgi:small subunit ribosomal protein S20